VINSVWTGDLVTRRKGHHLMDYVPYKANSSPSMWDHLDPSRMSVPRYQNLFRIFVWLLFLGVYSQAVREPLDRVNPRHSHLDPSEIALYVLAVSFSMEDINKVRRAVS
jgi:hypothetical protein